MHPDTLSHLLVSALQYNQLDTMQCFFFLPLDSLNVALEHLTTETRADVHQRQLRHHSAVVGLIVHDLRSWLAWSLSAKQEKPHSSCKQTHQHRKRTQSSVHTCHCQSSRVVVVCQTLGNSAAIGQLCHGWCNKGPVSQHFGPSCQHPVPGDLHLIEPITLSASPFSLHLSISLPDVSVVVSVQTILRSQISHFNTR